MSKWSSYRWFSWYWSQLNFTYTNLWKIYTRRFNGSSFLLLLLLFLLFLSSSFYHSVSVFLSHSTQLYRLLFLLSLLSLSSSAEWQLVEKQFIYYLIKKKKRRQRKGELFRFIQTIDKRMLVVVVVIVVVST